MSGATPTATGWDNTVPVAPTKTPTTTDLPVAGFGLRAAAMGVDLLLAAMVFLPLGMALAAAQGEPLSTWQARLLHDALPALLVVAFWCTLGATPGKWLCELRVVSLASGGRPSVKQAVLRYIGYFVSALPLGLGFLWVLWDRRRQGFHDRIAGTTVVTAEADESRKGLATLMREAGCRN